MELVWQLLQDLWGWNQVSDQTLRQSSVSHLSIICDVTHQTHQSEALTCCCSQSSQRGSHLLWKQLWVPVVQPRGVSSTDRLQVSVLLDYTNRLQLSWVLLIHFRSVFKVLLGSIDWLHLRVPPGSSVFMFSCTQLVCLWVSGRISVKSGIHFLNMKEQNITGCHTNTLTVSTHTHACVDSHVKLISHNCFWRETNCFSSFNSFSSDTKLLP